MTNKTKSNEEQRVLELRSENFEFDDRELTVSGYVNKAGDVSKVIGRPDSSGHLQFFYETIDPQAFIDSIENRPDGKPIDLYADHDPHKLLATTDNGSLELEVDEVGLHMRAQIVNTSDGRDAYELIKSGIMGKMSFGFKVKHASMDYSYANAHKYPLRKVDSLDLMEVSAVRFPAYLDTNIEARNSQEVFIELEKRGFNVSNFEFNNSRNGEDNLEMNFEEMKSDEIRSLIERGQQELERREDVNKPAEKVEQREIPQEKASSDNLIILKLDEGLLSKIKSALAKPTPQEKVSVAEHRDEDDDLDTDADKKVEEEQEDAEKPEEKPTEDEKEEEAEEDKEDEDERSLPSDAPQPQALDEHQLEIKSVIDSLKELFH